MKRPLMLAALLLALAACSGHTVHRIEVDFLSFVPEANRSGTLDLTTAQVQVPDDPAGQLVPVPGAEALLEGKVRVKAEVANTGTLPAQVDLEVRMGPEGDTNLYDDTDGDLEAKRVSLTLDPGATGTLDLTLDLAPGNPAFDLVKAGSFRIGARLNLSGEKVDYTLTQGEVALRLKLFNLIPNP